MHGVLAINSAAEERVMAERDDAGTGVLAEVLLQPHFFRRSGTATAKTRRAAVRVECDNVPHPEVETIVALAGWPGSIAPIPKIISRLGRSVFVITKSWVSSALETAPGLAVAVVEFGRVAVLISKIARGEDFSRNFLDEFGGGFRSSQGR